MTEALSKKYIKLAKTNLGEEQRNNPAHIEALRRWLSSMPHLTCPTDEPFLMMFLRQAKFSQARAQARIDNFCTISTMTNIGEMWSTPINLESPDFQKYLNMGIHISVRCPEEAKMVLWIRPGSWNPDELPFAKLFYYAYKVMVMIAFDPKASIGGMIVLLDFSNVTSKQTVKDPNIIKGLVRFFQEGFPCRISRIIFYNAGKVMETMIGIFMFYMKEKMRNRIIRVGNNISEAFEIEPGLKEILPPEIGGLGKPEAELKKAHNERFVEFFFNGDLTAEIKVNESQRPSSAKQFLSEYKDYDPNVMGTSGTYVKINQDETI